MPAGLIGADRIWWWAGWLTAAPWSLLAAILALAALLGGARLRWHCGAINVLRCPFGRPGALTMGHFVFYHHCDPSSRACRYIDRAEPAADACIRIDRHELAHILQYAALGPLFVPAYFLCGGVSADNRFERAADRFALTGRGWWPSGV